MSEFDHEQPDVYVAAIDVVAMLVQMVRRTGGTGSGTGTK